MTEIDISKVLIEGDTATIMGVKYKRIEEPKSPVKEAFKDWMGVYPPTNPSVDNIFDIRWRAFQKGYDAAYEKKVSEWQPTPQTPEQVADGLKEAFREAVKQGVVSSVDKPKDDFMDKMVAELKGQTLYDICREWCDDDENPPVSVLIDRIEEFLPKPQSAEGSQNAYVESAVEGFNDCLNNIKRKLR